jgi:phage terminase large subunit-like protein
MVESVIKTKAKDLNLVVRVKLVTATKGKFIRAEPIYALYEQGSIFHVGVHPILERQMCIFVTDSDISPDRVDALVWGFSELMLGSNFTFSI